MCKLVKVAPQTAVRTRATFAGISDRSRARSTTCAKTLRSSNWATSPAPPSTASYSTGDLHDLRGRKVAQPLVYHNDDHAAVQHPARMLREAVSNGIVYDSVRLTAGECAAVFRPPLLSNACQKRHLCYVWNGRQIVTVYEKREFGDDGTS